MRWSRVQLGVMGMAPHLTSCSLGVEFNCHQVHPSPVKGVLQRTDLRIAMCRRHGRVQKLDKLDTFTQELMGSQRSYTDAWARAQAAREEGR